MRRIWCLSAAVLGVAALAFTAVAAADSPASAGHLKHVFVIVLENHSQHSVIGDPNTPYITSLADEYGVARNYYGVTHPSEPNYIALIAGSNFGKNADDPSLRYDAPNIVDQLEATGHTWGAYEESLPSVGSTVDYWPSSSNALYASKHNPFVLFNDIRNDAARLSHIKPYTSLASDLNSSAAPDFAFIVPNQCHDMHGGVYTPVAADGSDGSPCPYGSTNNDANDASLKQKADAFVKQAVQTITSSKAWSG
ncbi:MAG TPA: alkaline phosphatase family protein, partial [Gaiellaceae bacterium]|nr:alkaline phosphatase family protein [Gaiellaceae bacterium]